MSKKNWEDLHIIQSLVEVTRASGRKIKKAEELVSRKQNIGGRFFAVENGHGRHPDQ